jgi:transcription elongation factor GreA
MIEKFQITKCGFERLKSELDKLKNIERPQIIQAIATARELGDLRENAEYHSAKDKQGFIEAQIKDFEEKLSRVEVIDVSKIISKNVVQFGATIELEDVNTGKKFTYKIVSDFEADIENKLISSSSPVARALVGKKKNDEIEVKIPSGLVNYEILDIKFV